MLGIGSGSVIMLGLLLAGIGILYAFFRKR